MFRHIFTDDNSKKRVLDSYVEDFIQKFNWESFLADEIQRCSEGLPTLVPFPKPFRLRNRKPTPNWKETSWWKEIHDPNVSNPTKPEGKKFRRRFRVPYPLFVKLVELSNQHNMFRVHQSHIPTELKVLAILRLLGRADCADNIQELSGLGESTINAFSVTRYGYITSFA